MPRTRALGKRLLVEEPLTADDWRVTPPERVHPDICARCGCDRKEQRRGRFRCKAWGTLYSSHIWGWEDPEHGQPGHECGSCEGASDAS